MDDDALRVWADFLRFHAKVVEVLEEELEEQTGLPLTWYDVLIQLQNAPEGRLRMQELADAIVLSKSGLTRLVDRLERAGLVARRSCPSDRRGTFAELTPAGRTRLAEARPAHLRGIEEHFVSHLDQHEQAVMGEVFARLLAERCVRPPGPGCVAADTSGA